MPVVLPNPFGWNITEKRSMHSKRAETCNLLSDFTLSGDSSPRDLETDIDLLACPSQLPLETVWQYTRRIP
jgi:hypothetical protein